MRKSILSLSGALILLLSCTTQTPPPSVPAVVVKVAMDGTPEIKGKKVPISELAGAIRTELGGRIGDGPAQVRIESAPTVPIGYVTRVLSRVAGLGMRKCEFSVDGQTLSLRLPEDKELQETVDDPLVRSSNDSSKVNPVEIVLNVCGSEALSSHDEGKFAHAKKESLHAPAMATAWIDGRVGDAVSLTGAPALTKVAALVAAKKEQAASSSPGRSIFILFNPDFSIQAKEVIGILRALGPEVLARTVFVASP
jgi:biopolymer transport protein ExbD